MEFQIQNHEYIELNKLLKLLGLVESGGHANIMITEGEVKVNGEIEFRKRRKMRVGDYLEFMNQKVKIVL